MVNEYYKAVKNTEKLAEQNAAQLQSINSATTVSAIANVATAVTSARQLKLQQQQLELSAQQAEAQEKYQLAMWRQTPNGQAYNRWSVEAARLLQELDERYAAWAMTWQHAIARARAEVPEDEVARFRTRRRTLRQSLLLVLSLVAMGAAALATYISIYAFTEVGRSGGGNEAGSTADWIVFILIFTLPALALAAIATFLLIRRHKKIKRAKADNRFEMERGARIAHWGFDPLAVSDDYVGFDLHDEQGLHSYVHSIELLRQSENQTPSREALVPLVLPEAVSPDSVVAPGEIKNLLIAIRQRSQAGVLPSDSAANSLTGESQ